MSKNLAQRAIIILLLTLSFRIGWAAAAPPVAGQPAISILPGEGRNLAISGQPSPSLVEVKLTSSAANWFAGTFMNLPMDKETTIELSLAGSGTQEEPASVIKWFQLHPVMTYADPARYESYTWYKKDTQGRWVSGDTLEQGKSHFAGAGKVPEQQVIPRELAEGFLSADGKYWSAWRDIESTKADMKQNNFTIKQKFGFPMATIAIRVPYPPCYEQAFCEKLSKANLPGVIVHNIGKSTQGRQLSVIEIDDPAELDKNRPVILLYGDEDGNEPDGSWVVDGAVRWLISDDPQALRVRHSTTFLLISQFDPDGFVMDTYENITKTFTLPDPKVRRPSETLAYTAFINHWIAQGRRLDLVCAYHNVECEESPNVQCPIIDWRRAQAMRALNQFVLSRLNGLETTDSVWMTGFLDERFCGWCYRHVGNLVTMYETNSRYPANRLTLAQLQHAGAQFAGAFTDYLASPQFSELVPEIDRLRRNHVAQQLRYQAQQKSTAHVPMEYETIVLGFE